MNRKTAVFEAFIEASGLEMTLDFASRQRTYSGISAKPLTQQEVMELVEFAGFVDGYEGHPSKFKFQQHNSPNHLKQMREQMAGAGIEMVPRYSGTNQERYERGYKLGFSARQN